MSSKLRSDKINFNNDDFLVEIELRKEPLQELEENLESETFEDASYNEEEISQDELIINRAREEANKILLEANSEADKIIDEAKSLKEQILSEAKVQADEILEEANKNAQSIIEKTTLEQENLLQNSSKEIEQKRVEEANRGYREGYEDAQEKLLEELEEKIQDFDNFCLKQYEIRNKILKTAGKDIFDIISNISKKILSLEPEAKSLEAIIQRTTALLEKKENINIILSEKYARILFEIQKKAINDDEFEFKFEDFKQYKGFSVAYSPDLSEDTIIIENEQERFDASISAQLDVIIRDILKNSKNGYLEIDDYIKEDETN